MENASRALIMAASVLLGIMIISVAVALFRSFGGSSAKIIKEIEQRQIAEFNSQFLKYYGEARYDDGVGRIKITAHDVVTMANLAAKNNVEYEVTDQTTSNQNSYYIQVRLRNKTENLEKQPEEWLTDFISKNDVILRCWRTYN